MPKTAEEHEREMMEKRTRYLQPTDGTPKMSSIICPKYYDKPCQLCELTFAYYRARLGKEHPLRQKAGDLNRKQRYFSNIILPHDPTTPIIFEYGDFIFKTLFGYVTDSNSEYKGFLHPITGRNFFIKKTVPPGNKRQTTYQIEMRVNQTPLPDNSVTVRQYNLDDVLGIIEEGKTKILRQSDLQEGRTEIRMLPSWLGPAHMNIFYVEVPFHYLSREEFDSIQTGKYNPFESAGISIQGRRDPVIIKEAPKQWKDFEVKPQEVNPISEPPCFRQYDAQSPLCLDRCAKQTGDPRVPMECQKSSDHPAMDRNEELRRMASRLYK